MYKETFKYQMTLFPVNINISSIGHKLQGRSKNIIIVSSWPKRKNNSCFRNWEYVILSQVQTLRIILISTNQYRTVIQENRGIDTIQKETEPAKATIMQKHQIT